MILTDTKYKNTSWSGAKRNSSLEDVLDDDKLIIIVLCDHSHCYGCEVDKK